MVFFILKFKNLEKLINRYFIINFIKKFGGNKND